MNLANEVRALVRATTSPIVFHPGGWEESLPDDIKALIVPSRLEALLDGGWDRATELEIMAYLFTGSLVSPMTHDLEQIYAYVTGLWKPDAAKDIGAPDELTAEQERLLGELQRDIWEALQRRKENFMPDKLKVVLDIEPNGVRVGIGAEGCDPIIRPLEGDLAVALDQLPGWLEDAKEQWETSPRNPKHVKPRASRSKTTKADSAEPPADAAAAQPASPETSAQPPADAATTEAVPAAANHTAAASELPLLGEGAPKDAELEDPPGAPEAELAAAERETRVAEAAAAEPIVGGVTMFQCPKCVFQAYSEAALGEHDEHTHPEGESASPEAADAPQAAAETTQAPEAAEAPAAPEPVGEGKYVIVATGKTHDTVHAALLDLGESQETIEGKQYWHRLDRLPKRLAEQIRKRD